MGGIKKGVETIILPELLNAGTTTVVRRFMHSRSRVTVDPCNSTIPGRSTFGVHPPGTHSDIHSVHQARSAVGCSASHTKGELHPTCYYYCYNNHL